jgi:hypothetical protein
MPIFVVTDEVALGRRCLGVQARTMAERLPASAKDLQGHRHLITFVNGPRTCLGKHFALAEFKVGLRRASGDDLLISSIRIFVFVM